MPLIGPAAMVAIYDVDEGWDAKHDHWHSLEHMHERVGIPGFLRGRRYLAQAGGKRCFVLYETSAFEVLTSEAYLTCLNNPTPWSSETVPHFKNAARTLCRVSVSVGHGIGGEMAYVGLSPKASGSEDLRRTLGAELERLIEQPGILAAHLLEGDDAASRIETKEKALRGRADSVDDWLLLVEGYGDPGEALESGPIARDALLTLGAREVGEVTRYTLGALLHEDEVR